MWRVPGVCLRELRGSEGTRSSRERVCRVNSGHAAEANPPGTGIAVTPHWHRLLYTWSCA